jgi:hypothetical protein
MAKYPTKNKKVKKPKRRMTFRQTLQQPKKTPMGESGKDKT